MHRATPNASVNPNITLGTCATALRNVAARPINSVSSLELRRGQVTASRADRPQLLLRVQVTFVPSFRTEAWTNLQLKLLMRYCGSRRVVTRRSSRKSERHRKARHHQEKKHRIQRIQDHHPGSQIGMGAIPNLPVQSIPRNLLRLGIMTSPFIQFGDGSRTLRLPSSEGWIMK